MLDIDLNMMKKWNPDGFWMPIAFVTKWDEEKQCNYLPRNKSDLPIPEKTEDGRFVYALPGGGRYVG